MVLLTWNPTTSVVGVVSVNSLERARRRYQDLTGKGSVISYNDVLRDMEERDARGSSRAAAPLKPAPDAITVDNTNLTIRETVQLIINLFKEITEAENLSFQYPEEDKA